MKNIILLPLFGLASLLFAGCASYTIQPISPTSLDQNWRDGKADAGYVFYQPELYFMVAPNPAQKGATNNATADAPPAKPGDAGADKSSGFSVTPVYLPNPQKPYRVTTFNFLAKSDFTFNFKDGWQLSSIADKADNTTVANTLSGELKTILSAAGFTTQAVQEKKAFLLHPKYDPQTGIITGFDVAYLPSFTP